MLFVFHSYDAPTVQTKVMGKSWDYYSPKFNSLNPELVAHDAAGNAGIKTR
jgi:hypothetical protein